MRVVFLLLPPPPFIAFYVLFSHSLFFCIPFFLVRSLSQHSAGCCCCCCRHHHLHRYCSTRYKLRQENYSYSANNIITTATRCTSVSKAHNPTTNHVSRMCVVFFVYTCGGGGSAAYILLRVQVSSLENCSTYYTQNIHTIHILFAHMFMFVAVLFPFDSSSSTSSSCTFTFSSISRFFARSLYSHLSNTNFLLNGFISCARDWNSIKEASITTFKRNVNKQKNNISIS